MKWASWLNIFLGAWLIIAPSTLGYLSSTASANDVTIGIALLMVGVISVMVTPMRTWAAWINLLLGIWLVIAPWALAYGPANGRANANDLIVGMLAILFSGIRIASARRVATI